MDLDCCTRILGGGSFVTNMILGGYVEEGDIR